MKFVRRGGLYFRVCDPEWASPLDTSFNKERGGRWNPPGKFGLLHLNATIRVAAANARKHFEDEIHTLFDLRPQFRPVLYDIAVRRSEFVDCVTDQGLRDVGLTAGYPENTSWLRTRAVGIRAHQNNEDGIASRSAAEMDRNLGEELAIFDDRTDALTKLGQRRAFDKWYPVLADPYRGKDRL